MKALVLCTSPRRDGNSTTLAKRAALGLSDAGHDVDLLYADDVLASFLGDCRRCRTPSGECAIEDGFRDAFVDKYLPADGFVAATPIYWYGMSAQLKAFFDRMFCYVAASHPRSPDVIRGMQGKRIGLILSSEEIYPTVSAGIVQQLNEYCRYTRSTFVGLVHGYGNARGDVARDPHDPVAQAHRLGQELFTYRATDYQIDTPRSVQVWDSPGVSCDSSATAAPACARSRRAVG